MNQIGDVDRASTKVVQRGMVHASSPSYADAQERRALACSSTYRCARALSDPRVHHSSNWKRRSSRTCGGRQP